jgi:two-component system, sensor histidine kinase and response regulator
MTLDKSIDRWPSLRAEDALREQPGGRRLRVLLAEDNEINQKLATLLLMKQGHSVTVAENGKAALDRLDQEQFDLVLMDIQMPEMTGLEAATAIRAREQEAGGHIPIIALTAHAMKGDRELCLKAGMDLYLSKPIQSAELFEAIEKLTGIPALIIATPAPPTPDRGLLDRSALLESTGGSASLLQGIARLFVKKYPLLLAQIRQAVADDDAIALTIAAHKLKGGGGHFLTHAAREAAHRLELMGRENNLDAAHDTLGELEREMARLDAELVGIAEGQSI